MSRPFRAPNDQAAAAQRTLGDEVRLQWQRDYQARNKDARTAYNGSERGRRLNRARSLKFKFGITLEEYEALYEKQGGLCAICRRPQRTQTAKGTLFSLAVDHDHLTGRVRGLLCTECNHGIGCFRDDPSTLQAAISYLADSGSESE